MGASRAGVPRPAPLLYQNHQVCTGRPDTLESMSPGWEGLAAGGLGGSVGAAVGKGASPPAGRLVACAEAGGFPLRPADKAGCLSIQWKGPRPVIGGQPRKSTVGAPLRIAGSWTGLHDRFAPEPGATERTSARGPGRRGMG